MRGAMIKCAGGESAYRVPRWRRRVNGLGSNACAAYVSINATCRKTVSFCRNYASRVEFFFFFL